ncbi:MAG: glycosyltransferase [Leptolyngbya sp. SIO4C1]|nr:glycosyltransferase [Leptolyngbya sp. SIO4C1]
MTQSFLFSVIIPTYNRPERLRQCLSALAEQTLAPQQFEIMVIDDGSDCPLEPVVAAVQAKAPQLIIRLSRQTNAGPAQARNAGAARAAGHYLVFTDDDCAPLPDWLEQFAAQLQGHPDCLMGGYTINALAQNPFSTASQLLIDYLYSYYNREAQASFFASNNFVLPRAAFLAKGGFDTSFPLAAGEDRELCDRLVQQGYPMRYAPQAQIRHYHSLTLRKFWRQHFNYGRGAYHFHQVRAQRQAAPVQVEPLSFYTRLLTYPFAQPDRLRAVSLSLLMFLSQVANVAGFFWERRRAA